MEWIDTFIGWATAIAGICVLRLISRVGVDMRNKRDDAFVSSFLHSSGRMFRHDITVGLRDLPNDRIDLSLARLCSTGVVERCIDNPSAPYFTLIELAESRIGGE